MWALSRPVFVHCATNSRCDRRAIARVTTTDTGTVTSVMPVNTGEIVTIISSTVTTVSTALNNWAIVIDNDVCRLSMSLVTRLSTSPRCRLSK